MAALSDAVKHAIVQALACYDSPSEVAEQIARDFGVRVPRQQVALYDPTKPAGKGLSPKLRAVFAVSRSAFERDVATIPIAHKAYRLRHLQRQLEQAEDRGNVRQVLRLLEQAAREVGGMYTNRRELTGKGGVPIAQAALPPEFASVAKAVAFDEASVWQRTQV